MTSMPKPARMRCVSASGVFGVYVDVQGTSGFQHREPSAVGWPGFATSLNRTAQFYVGQGSVLQLGRRADCCARRRQYARQSRTQRGPAWRSAHGIPPGHVHPISRNERWAGAGVPSTSSQLAEELWPRKDGRATRTASSPSWAASQSRPAHRFQVAIRYQIQTRTAEG